MEDHCIPILLYRQSGGMHDHQILVNGIPDQCPVPLLGVDRVLPFRYCDDEPLLDVLWGFLWLVHLLVLLSNSALVSFIQLTPICVVYRLLIK